MIFNMNRSKLHSNLNYDQFDDFIYANFSTGKRKQQTFMASAKDEMLAPSPMYLTNFYGRTVPSKEEVKMCWEKVQTSCLIIIIARHIENVVGQCSITDCYFQH